MTDPLDLIENRLNYERSGWRFALEGCANDPEAAGICVTAMGIRALESGRYGAISPEMQDALDRETAILAARLHELRERRRMRGSLLQHDPCELTENGGIAALIAGWAVHTSGPGRAFESQASSYLSYDAIDVNLPQGGTCVSFDGVPVFARAYGTTDLDDYRAGHRQVVETVLRCIEVGRDDVAGVVSALGALDVKEGA